MLCENIEKYGAKNIETLNGDFIKVDYILLGPSCSGSGIHNNCKKDQKRINMLKNFQCMMLNHAIKFNPKNLVYSVCSIYKEEDVVREALEKNLEYELEDLPNYTGIRGHLEYDFAEKVIRSDNSTPGEIGFFIALFKRKQL